MFLGDSTSCGAARPTPHNAAALRRASCAKAPTSTPNSLSGALFCASHAFLDSAYIVSYHPSIACGRSSCRECAAAVAKTIKDSTARAHLVQHPALRPGLLRCPRAHAHWEGNLCLFPNRVTVNAARGRAALQHPPCEFEAVLQVSWASAVVWGRRQARLCLEWLNV